VNQDNVYPNETVESGTAESDMPAPIERSVAEVKRAIEAIILVSSESVPEILLAQLIEVPVDTIHQCCLELSNQYSEQNHGFELAAVAGGWRYQTCSDLSEYMERYAMEGVSTKLSSAALETLSIIAYKQPISRVQVSAIRGVNVDGVLKTIVQRGYVEEKGVDSGPGQAILYGTSQFFLEQIGLESIEDLPALGEFVPSAAVLEALEETLKISDEPEVDTVTPAKVGTSAESDVISEEVTETSIELESEDEQELDDPVVIDLRESEDDLDNNFIEPESLENE